MGASEKAVAAVHARLGCKERVVHDLRWCVTHDVIGALWTDRGCPVAVAAADAAVDTDRPSIEAQALREAAFEADTPINRGATLAGKDMAQLLFCRADRIEAQP